MIASSLKKSSQSGLSYPDEQWLIAQPTRFLPSLQARVEETRASLAFEQALQNMTWHTSGILNRGSAPHAKFRRL